MSYISKIFNNCSEVSKLSLQEATTPLSLKKKIETYLHIKLCKCCQNFVKQSTILDKAIKTYISNLGENPKFKASDEFKNKLKDTLKDQ